MTDASHVEPLMTRAAALREQGRFREAVEAYEALLRAAPQLPTAWYNLGYCQRMCGRFEDALASYLQAIARGLDQAEEAHLNRAVIFADALRREGDAEQELKRALGLNPKYAPALFNLANLYEDFGRRREALSLYEQILTLDPQHWEALSRHANLLPRGEQNDNVVAQLNAALAGSDISNADRASLGFALGRSLDRTGQYDAAFNAYARANVESQRAHGGGYDRAQSEALIARIASAFADAAPHAPVSDAAPIFICGMFRSGSTLAEQVLAGHKHVRAGGELDLIPALARGKLAPFPERAAQLTAADYAALAQNYADHVRRLFPDASIVTDKRPDNFLYVGLIKRMFPKAKIVHTVRHPLDNVLSVYFLHLDASLGYAFDLIDTAHQLRLSRQLMAHWRALYPGDIIDFDYDAFVADPRAAAQGLMGALSLDWDEECLAFHRRRNAVKTASVWQVREPLYTTSSGRWRNYAAQLAPVRDYLSDLL